jgi:hypothetical protein
MTATSTRSHLSDTYPNISAVKQKTKKRGLRKLRSIYCSTTKKLKFHYKDMPLKSGLEP